MHESASPKAVKAVIPDPLDYTIREIADDLLLPEDPAAIKKYIPIRKKPSGKLIASYILAAEKIQVWNNMKLIYGVTRNELLKLSKRLASDIQKIKCTLGQNEWVFRRFLLLWALELHIGDLFEYYALGKQARAENINPALALKYAEKSTSEAYALRKIERDKVANYISIKLKNTDSQAKFRVFRSELRKIVKDLKRLYAWMLMLGYKHEPNGQKK